MKKILLATTLLAGTAGFAAAEEAKKPVVSGDARMGIVNNGTDTQFTNRFRVAFAASGATDGGLQFGASIRADNSAAGAAGTAGSVYIDGAFGKLTMGDVDSAFGATFGNIAGVGLTGVGDRNEISHSADGGAFGALPGTFSGGVLTTGAYNGLFTAVADVDPGNGPAVPGFETSGARLIAFGGNVSTVWGRLFNANAYQAEVTAQAGLAAGTLAAGVNLASQATPAAEDLNEAGFLGSMREGFAESIDAAAVSAGLLTAANNVAGADFAPNQLFAVNAFNKANAIALAQNQGNAYLSFDISTSGVTAIPARVLYEYSIGDFAVAASYSQTGANEAYSVAGSYAVNGLKVSAGIAKATWEDAIVASITGFGELANGTNNADGSLRTGTFTIRNAHDLEADDLNLGVSYKMGDVTVAGVMQRREFAISGNEVDQIDSTGVSVAYSANGLGLSAFVMSTDGTVSADSDNYGVGASYDLGGGATVKGGISGGDAATQYDFGVSFTF